MNNIKHIFENAITALEHNHDYEYWVKQNAQQIMLPEVKAAAFEIWLMAQYCVYTYKPCIEADLVEKAERDYGYKWPE